MVQTRAKIPLGTCSAKKKDLQAAVWGDKSLHDAQYA
jgi:hypothetical protein